MHRWSETRPAHGALCVGCGREFLTKNVHRDFAACSLLCRVLSGLVLGEPDECWPWQQRCDKDGYGEFIFDTTKWRAHRAMYFLKNGPIAARAVIMHSCDNPPCCNDRHLGVGTRSSNSLDMHRKGRGVALRGTDVHSAKLDEDKVRLIRSSDLPQVELAKLFGVKPHAIFQARHRLTWRHVGD